MVVSSPSYPQVSPLSVNKPKVEVHNPLPRPNITTPASTVPLKGESGSGAADHGAIDPFQIREVGEVNRYSTSLRRQVDRHSGLQTISQQLLQLQ